MHTHTHTQGRGLLYIGDPLKSLGPILNLKAMCHVSLYVLLSWLHSHTLYSHQRKSVNFSQNWLLHLWLWFLLQNSAIQFLPFFTCMDFVSIPVVSIPVALGWIHLSVCTVCNLAATKTRFAFCLNAQVRMTQPAALILAILYIINFMKCNTLEWPFKGVINTIQPLHAPFHPPLTFTSQHHCFSNHLPPQVAAGFFIFF